MADEPPRQSWMARNSYVVVGAIVAVLGALTWLVSMPFGSKPAPPVVQSSQPQPVAADSATRAAEERIAAERTVADERAFAQAAQADSVAAFETYIRTNPSGARIAEAQQRIAALNEQARRATEERAAAEQAAARAAEERAWTEATQTGTVAAFEAYVRNNPASTRTAEAQQRIAALNEQARRAADERAAAERAATERAAAEQAAAAARAAEERAAAERAAAERAAAARAADERAWVEAAQARTVAALEAYVRNNPAGTRIAEAQQRIAIINEQARRVAEERAAAERAAAERATAERLAAEKAAAEKVAAERAADDKAFAEATQTGSIAAFEAYIRNNAAGAHLIEAARRIAQLRDDERVKQAAAAKAVRTTSSVDSNRPYVPQRPVYKAPPLQR